MAPQRVLQIPQTISFLFSRVTTLSSLGISFLKAPDQMTNFSGLLLLSLYLSVALAGATQFKVGGHMGWTLPADPNAMSYNQWAEKNRFQIGDSLLFVYVPYQDSVLQVDNDAYRNCNTSSYIAKFSDGNTLFTLNRSGLFYFISGVKQNCNRNESLVVRVMADRSKNASGANQGSLGPSAAPPSPPESTSSPPVPPPSSTEVSSSPAPAANASNPPPPPPNGATMMVASFMGSLGAVFWGLLSV